MSFAGYQIWGEDLLSNAVSGYFLVAVDDVDRRIVGYAIARFYPQNEPHVMVHDLYVSNDCGDEGIMRIML